MKLLGNEVMRRMPWKHGSGVTRCGGLPDRAVAGGLILGLPPRTDRRRWRSGFLRLVPRLTLAYLPVQTGLRFSAKAAAPSRASADENTGATSGRWRSNIS